ncbi:hypothetical protein SAMN05421858_4723 [Haladaptatus litoreus]|uniref:Uncharacterized protein n=1 Tax=Haladaptatus litoreus TaxID=553468 RepID=A0A1N7F1T7_9EURY|nr:hypothetical protein [Haladaptatus litoreus]SIR94276.1 hypothetical protein SAMN05421858_4723 [Haladaptatus litoreus]
MENYGTNASPRSSASLSRITKFVIAVILLLAALYSLAIEGRPMFFVITAVIIGLLYTLFRIAVIYRS